VSEAMFCLLSVRLVTLIESPESLGVRAGLMSAKPLNHLNSPTLYSLLYCCAELEHVHPRRSQVRAHVPRHGHARRGLE
jgi:hypothetical protein